MKYSLVTQTNLAKINRDGTRLSAQIIDVRKLKVAGKTFDAKTLYLEFKNLQNETVLQKMDINDSRPMENRYEVGNTVYLKVDETFKRSPYFILEGIQSRIKLLPFIIWVILLLGVLYYYDYSYNLENAGYGWRFLTIGHPLISTAGFMIFYTGIFYLIFRFFIFKKFNIGKESIILKFKGKKTIAKIINAEQTGTFINEQPEVKFDIEFRDASGNVYNETIRKIVLLTDIAFVKTRAEREVFYDPNNPQNVMFEEDINEI